jgi:hypothetical protein
MPAQRIDPEQARAAVETGSALLVCAYDDEEKCQNYGLKNAISLTELQRQEAALSKDRKIFFYCA